MSKKHIIIIETRENNRKEVSSLLKKRGFRVSSLPYSDKSLPARVQEKNPDLLLADLSFIDEEIPLDILTDIKHENQIPLIIIARELNEASYDKIMAAEPDCIAPVEVGKWHLLSAIETHLKNNALIIEKEEALDSLEKHKESLQINEARFRGTFESAAHGMLMADNTGRFTAVNQTFQKMIGYSEEELLTKTIKDITHPDDLDENLDFPEAIKNNKNQSFQMEKRYIRKDQSIMWGLLNVSIVHDPSGALFQLITNILDITEYRKALETFKTVLRYYQESSTMSIDDIINESLEEGVRLTESQIGFFHLVEADQQTISLQTWTKNTLNFCTALEKGTHYPVADAGVWADCIRERKPVIHNDYPDLTHKKGLPDGHVPVSREMALPIFQDNKVVAAMGVGNKSRDYTQLDLEKLSLIAESMWSVVQHRNYEAALQESEEQHRLLFETMTQGVVYQDPEGYVTSVNPAAEKILGLSLEQLQGRTSMDPRWETIHEDGTDFPGDRHPAMVALKTEKPVNNVVIGIFNPLENRHRWVNVSATPQFKAGDSSPFQVYATLEDITERKDYEEALKESQERYRSMFINNHAVMLILDPEYGSIINANPAACDFYGYSRKELTAKNISEINTLTLEETKTEMEQARSEKRKYFIFKHHLKNGELRDVEVYSGPILLSGKQYLFSIIHDITIRKKIETALRFSEEQHRTLFETMTQGAIYFNADGTVISVNPAAARILQSDIETMKGKKPVDYPHEVITEENKIIKDRNFPVGDVLKSGKILKDFLIGIKPEGFGNYRWILVNAIPQYRDNHDKPDQIYATYTDITELHEAQEEINLFFNVTLDMLCIANFDGYFTKLSPSWSENLGWTNEELMSRPFVEFVHSEDFEKTVGKTINLTDGKEVINFVNRYRCKDGSYRWLSWNAFGITGRGIIIAAAHDITRIKNNEEALKKSEQRLKEAQHVAHLGYWEIDYGTNSLFWSDEVFRIFGVNPENFTVKYESFLEAIHPDEREYVNQRYEESINLKNDYQINHRIIRPDGEIRHVFEKCENYFDTNKNIERSLGIIIDITDRVKTEEKLLLAMQEGDIAREEAIRANQIKSEFLANMSHEIRTPLNAVIGFSELLTSLVFDQQQKSYLASIKTAGKSLLTLINDILDLSKIEAGMMKITRDLVNLNELFNELELIFSSEITEKKLEFILEIDPELPPGLILDETRLRQVLLNIAGNAVKFTDKGYIKLTAQKKYLQEDRSTLDLIITVEDTGIGIPDEEFEGIFESFRQQTGQSNRRYGGTGLGLSISKKLLELMNGEITLSSRVGTGSTFIIKLKDVNIAALTGVKEVHASPHHENILFKGSRILIVDDVESNRRFLRDLLAKKNLVTLEAENGEEALIMMREESFNAVLMDIRMPVMDGFEAIKKIRGDKNLDQCKIIALTASAQQENRTEILKAGFDAYLAKPISTKILFDELARFIPFKNSGTAEAVTSKANDHKPDRLPADLAPELQEILKTEIIASTKKLSGAIKPGEIIELADRLTELSSLYGVEELMHYGSLLTELIENYDIAETQKVLEQINKIIQID